MVSTFSRRSSSCTLSMKVCLPLSLTIDWALFASSGRTKFDESVVFTTRSPPLGD